MPLPGSLCMLIGEIRNVDQRRKAEVARRVKEMTAQGYTATEIGQTIQTEYRAAVDGRLGNYPLATALEGI